VNVSAKTEYACIAMTELAAQFRRGEPVRIRSIADTHGIPARFLVQILLQLKSAGLVNSTRGASGGYQLARPPREISLEEVMAVIEGRSGDSVGGAAQHSPFAAALSAVWQDVAAAERRVLSSVSLYDVLERAGEDADHMYYI
jgi:Rrf2 family protein